MCQTKKGNAPIENSWMALFGRCSPVRVPSWRMAMSAYTSHVESTMIKKKYSTHCQSQNKRTTQTNIQYYTIRYQNILECKHHESLSAAMPHRKKRSPCVWVQSPCHQELHPSGYIRASTSHRTLINSNSMKSWIIFQPEKRRKRFSFCGSLVVMCPCPFVQAYIIAGLEEDFSADSGLDRTAFQSGKMLSQ